MKLLWSSFPCTKSVWINRSKSWLSSIRTCRQMFKPLTQVTTGALKIWITQLAPWMPRNKTCPKPLWSRLRRQREPLFISNLLFRPSWVSGIRGPVASIKLWSMWAPKTQMKQRFIKVTRPSLYPTRLGKTSLLFRLKLPLMSVLRDSKARK